MARFRRVRVQNGAYYFINIEHIRWMRPYTEDQCDVSFVDGGSLTVEGSAAELARQFNEDFELPGEPARSGSDVIRRR